MASYCVDTTEKKLSECMYSEKKRDIKFLKILEFFEFMKTFWSGIFDFFYRLLIINSNPKNHLNYKFKSNQPSGASGVEVKQQVVTAKVCGSHPAGPFFANYRFCAFSDYRPSVGFCWLISTDRTIF